MRRENKRSLNSYVINMISPHVTRLNINTIQLS
jgi:hypothetical protein